MTMNYGQLNQAESQIIADLSDMFPRPKDIYTSSDTCYYD